MTINREVSISSIATSIVGTVAGGPGRRVSIYEGVLNGSATYQDRCDAAKMMAAAPDLYAALEKIVEMNVQYCLDRYGDASKADTMGCVVTAREAMAKVRTVSLKPL